MQVISGSFKKKGSLSSILKIKTAICLGKFIKSVKLWDLKYLKITKFYLKIGGSNEVDTTLFISWFRIQHEITKIPFSSRSNASVKST